MNHPFVVDGKPMPYRRYIKKGLTKAKILTQKDFEERGGKIQTLEGEATFVPGDHLAIGVKKEIWPISAKTMADTKEYVSGPDAEGWSLYKTTTTVMATPMDAEFSVLRTGTADVLKGKAGDYIVIRGGEQWVVDAEIFTHTYEPVGPGVFPPSSLETEILARLEQRRKDLIVVREKTGEPIVPTFIGGYIFFPKDVTKPGPEGGYFVLGPDVAGVVYELPSANPNPIRMVFSLATRWEIAPKMDMIERWFQKRGLPFEEKFILKNQDL